MTVAATNRMRSDDTGPRRARHDYPPTAQKILTTAQRILAKKGYSSLTMQAIEKESGVNRSLVHYYFGNKAGLVEALVDTLFEDPSFGYSDGVLQVPAGEERAQALIEWLHGITTATPNSARLLYELLPQILRSKKLRERLAELYAAYREFDGDCLGSGAPELDPATLASLGALSVAIVEGLLIQTTLDSRGFSSEGAFSLWQDIITQYLRSTQSRDVEKERS